MLLSHEKLDYNFFKVKGQSRREGFKHGGSDTFSLCILVYHCKTESKKRPDYTLIATDFIYCCLAHDFPFIKYSLGSGFSRLDLAPGLVKDRKEPH